MSLLQNQGDFTNLAIQDTDYFWIVVDLGGGSFDSFKMTGLQLKDFMKENSNFYIAGTSNSATDNKTGSIQRSGAIIIRSTDNKGKTTLSSQGVYNETFDTIESITRNSTTSNSLNGGTRVYRARGTSSANETYVQTSDIISERESTVYDETQEYVAYREKVVASENHTDTTHGIEVVFEATKTGANALSEVMRFKSNGKTNIQILNLPVVTNSSPENGDIWYDGTNLKFRKGATTVNIA